MNSPAYFEIQSSDPPREIAFYEAVFGWTFIRERNLPIEYYRIETGTIAGGLLRRPAAPPEAAQGTNAFVCSMQADDFDAVTDRILAAGGQVAMPKFPIPGRCWQGYFLDTGGNTFGIFEADENAG